MSIDQKAASGAMVAKPRPVAPKSEAAEATPPLESAGNRGPMVEVTAKAPSLVGRRVVNGGGSYTVPEQDAVEAIVRGVVEREGVHLTSRGQRYLAEGCKVPYSPPEQPVAKVIPTVKMAVLSEGVVIGDRVHSKGDVADVPEDEAAWMLLLDEKERVLALAPGAELSPRGASFLSNLAGSSGAYVVEY